MRFDTGNKKASNATGDDRISGNGTGLEARNVSFRYSPGKAWILRDINLHIEEGERAALVAPSGYGKSTLAKILAGYEKPEEGEVLWQGKPLPEKGYCPVQLIYQHPELAVNPRWKMEKIVTECWNPPEELLRDMGIEEEWLTRWPSELSGGELQRFCVVRALGPQTRFLICDEISTMLDVITQAQIWQRVLKEAEKNRIGILVVTHNPALARQVCTRVIDLPQLNKI